jgi:hypothetical protein
MTLRSSRSPHGASPEVQASRSTQGSSLNQE